MMRSLNKTLVYKYNNKLSTKLCKNKFSNSYNVSGVYKIDCNNCKKFYIGETGRDLNVRMKEHKKDICNVKSHSGVVDHVLKTGHDFNFLNIPIIYPNMNVSKRYMESLYIFSLINVVRI